MNIKQIDGATHYLGKSQGFLGLPVRQDAMTDGTPMMVTAWEPLPDEIERINAGASIVLSLLGTVINPGHPPVFITVGSAPDVLPSKWKPIADAPDDREVLMKLIDDTMHVAKWHYRDKWTTFQGMLSFTEDEIIGWMELPE